MAARSLRSLGPVSLALAVAGLVACGSSEGHRRAKAEPDGGDGDDSGSAGRGATGGKAGTGGAATGGRTASGGAPAGGRPGSGGTAAGGAPTGGAGGAGGVLGAGGGAPEAGVPDAGPTGPVVRVELGSDVYFQAADGTVLQKALAPAEYPLPDGGQVTFAQGNDWTTYVNVPEGTVIQQRYPVNPTPQSRQSIRVNVTAWKAGLPIYISSGCASATGPGQRVLPMDTSCLEDDVGEVYIYTWESGEGAYIHVPSIAIGAAGDAVKNVALPAWTAFGAPPSFTVDDQPAGLEGELSVYLKRGTAFALSNFTASMLRQPDGSGASSPNALFGDVGTRADVGFSLHAPYQGQDYLDFSFTSVQTQNPPPLPPNTPFVRGELLPLIQSATFQKGSRRVAWTTDGVGSVAGLDRVRVRLDWGADGGKSSWTVLAPPATSPLSLPVLPSELVLPATISRLELELEDQDAVTTFAETFSVWLEHLVFSDQSREVPARLSRFVDANP